jgi:hypothetical protein
LLIAVAIVALMLAAAAASPAAATVTDPTLEAWCEPPSPPLAANCAGWHTSPVTVHWVVNPPVIAPCPPTTISEDTAGQTVTCDPNLLGLPEQTATIQVDKTPPAVTGAVPDRPPDHSGWYNHPVSFTFGGADATSGLAGCDSVTYNGPDTASGGVSGACRDVAGNSASGSAPLKYDATPPTVTLVPQDSNDGQVDLKWSASPDAVQYSVTRSPGTDGQGSSTVYSGPNTSYTDRNVAESQSYTYTIVAADAAANASAIAIVALPGGSQKVLGAREVPPATPVVTPRPALPRLQWRRVRHARYYNVQLYRGTRKIWSTWPARNRLQLKSRWTYKRKHYRLSPGRYHWYVWPGFGSRRAHRYGKLIAHRRFTVKKV